MWETFAATVLRFISVNTRRNRLRKQVESQTKLLAAVKKHAPNAAQPLNDLIKDTVEAFVGAERAAMQKKLNVMNVSVGFVLTVPTGIASVLVYLWVESWWKWLILVPTVAWTVLWLIYVATVLYEEEKSSSPEFS